ncbi:related to MNR2 - Manganese resistance protein [Melanopsichium pennsylvanicum]|uniref:Related to MNR2 - Manganese resistance protein n=2 Tax=Melanopsichium pennsylvanicum TaxID=63383 RepID=A0AAJ5C2N1_9BASI|nr:related to MNR2-Manganese resistance protein [Melanopsichium pennsylvanicum 4]SNX81677.1 related to MNR2 - Manganese resistance protein [Melanopsichium pennsylvanicum]
MSSPQHYYGSLSSGRAVSPPLDSRPSLDANRADNSGDHQLQQDLDAARQMSKARGKKDPSSPRGSFSDDQAEPYFHEGLNRSPAAVPIRAPAPPSSAAAARFYQHNRNGSSTSLDSQHHFIDHRHQPHSLSNVHSPSALRGRSALSRTPMRSPNTYFPGSRANDHALIDADDDDIDADASHLSRSGQHVRRSSHQSHPSSPSPVQDDRPDVAPRFRRDSTVEDDVCFPMHDTHASEARPHEDLPQHLHAEVRDAYASRADNGYVPLGYPFTFDLAALEDFASEERDRIGMSSSWNAAASPNSGLRQRGAAAQKGTGGPGYGVSPDSDDATFYSRRPRKLSSSAGAFGSSKYQRKLALFEGGGSAPPPVAGAAASNSILGGGSALASGDPKRSMDVNTPLLDNDSLPSYHGNNGPTRMHSSQSQSRIGPITPGIGAHGRARSQTGAFSNRGGEKPYRFTFYSNALPSTIHARHLSELPAEGQTFEQLFSGREKSLDHSPPTEDSQSRNASRAPTINATTARMASLGQMFGRMEGTTAPPTGSNTPVHVNEEAARAMSGLSASRTKALPGGGIRMEPDPEANTWWLDVLSPTDQEMKLLSRVFGIHPLTTEDILMEETREKIELFRNYYLVCFRSFDQDPYSPTYLEPLNMYIIVFREGTLSFHFRGTPHPQNVRRRIKQLKDYINVTSDWISYALIDDITDAFGPLIQSIEYEVDSIDELVLILKEAEQSDMLRRIGTCRKKVMGLLRLMGNKADVVKGLAKRCNENWSVAPKSDIGLYLSDIQDHLITMTQNLNHYEKILSRSHSNYLAQISIEMTDANNQINDVLSKLTALGTVIVPMNVITGLWGMNVNVPGEGVENLRWFAGICSVMVVIAVSGYIAATRYLERSH